GEMYGKIMSIPDALLWSWYELLTDVPAAEIAAKRKAIEAGANPRDAKAELARTITAQFHDAAAAARAEEDFRRAFSRGEVPADVETREVSAEGGAPAAKTLVAIGLAASMREARRKIDEGALRVYGPSKESEPREIRDPEENLAAPDAGDGLVLRLGRRFIRVTWKR